MSCCINCVDLESITVGKGVEGVAGGVLEDLEENEDTLEVLEVKGVPLNMTVGK